MIIPRLSVFLENKSGRLTEVLEVLGKENIRITAIDIYGLSEVIGPGVASECLFQEGLPLIR